MVYIDVFFVYFVYVCVGNKLCGCICILFRMFYLLVFLFGRYRYEEMKEGFFLVIYVFWYLGIK